MLAASIAGAGDELLAPCDCEEDAAGNSLRFLRFLTREASTTRNLHHRGGMCINWGMRGAAYDWRMPWIIAGKVDATKRTQKVTERTQCIVHVTVTKVA